MGNWKGHRRRVASLVASHALSATVSAYHPSPPQASTEEDRLATGSLPQESLTSLPYKISREVSLFAER